ncbi:hypothetical protein [Nocardioides yefusunii]|uniref:Uncharacterized protein n=1 Tax=Nocardioides yefusunii TaxID=2500546 RepID=A0ABW1R069_9ACTN|nr:hypothetical protein [Nocardioides yefusunii]
MEMVDFFAGTPAAALYSGAESLDKGDALPGMLDLASSGLDVVGLFVKGAAVDTAASFGVSWLIEHMYPLDHWLDSLGGSPDAVRSFSATFASSAASLAVVEQENVHGATLWTGEAAGPHAVARAATLGATRALARMLESEAASLERVAMAVDAVRSLIRSVISDLIVKAVRNFSLAGFVPVVGQAAATFATAADAAKEAANLRKTYDAVILLLRGLDDAILGLLGQVDDVMLDLAKKVVGDGKGLVRAGWSALSSSSASGLRYAEEQP